MASANTILADERSRDFEQMIADMTIKSDPVPVGGDIYLPDTLSFRDRLTITDNFDLNDDFVANYKAVPRNLLLNPKFQDNLFAWQVNQSSSHREENSISWDASQIDIDRHLTTSIGVNLSGVEDHLIESTVSQVVPFDPTYTFFLEAWGKIIDEEERRLIGNVELKCRVVFLNETNSEITMPMLRYETNAITSVEENFTRLRTPNEMNIPTGAVFARVEIVFGTDGLNSTINAHIMNIRFVIAPKSGSNDIDSLLLWDERAIVGRHSAN